MLPPPQRRVCERRRRSAHLPAPCADRPSAAAPRPDLELRPPGATGLHRADLAIVATVDATGMPWAWPLAGPPGLVGALGSRLMRVRPPHGLPQGLAGQLRRAPQVGLLALDVKTGETSRADGLAAALGDRLTVAVDEPARSSGRLSATRVGVARHTSATPTRRFTALSDAHRELVARSTMVFVATPTSTGPVAACGCGPAGFMHAQSSRSGMDHYVTGGPADSPYGEPLSLTFIDFGSGAWLQTLLAAPESGRRRLLAAAQGPVLPRRWNRPSDRAGVV